MASRSKLPPPRMTIEVDASWLVTEEAKERKSLAPRSKSIAPKPAKKVPPPIPGAGKHAPPPMPVVSPPSVRPPQRMTMEVKAEWLEDVTAAGELPPSKRGGERRSEAPPSKRKKGPPIPRED